MTTPTGTICCMDGDPEATQPVLETLFTVRGMVADIHAVSFDDEEPDDGEAQEEEDA